MNNFGMRPPLDCGDECGPPERIGDAGPDLPGEMGSAPGGGEAMLHPPELLPEPELNQPQQFPGESAPPEPALAGDQVVPGAMSPPALDCGPPQSSRAQMVDERADLPAELQTSQPRSETPPMLADEASQLRRVGGYGGIVGGAIEQKWADALPSTLPDTAAERTYTTPPGLSQAEVMRDGERRYWGQWLPPGPVR